MSKAPRMSEEQFREDAAKRARWQKGAEVVNTWDPRIGTPEQVAQQHAENVRASAMLNALATAEPFALKPTEKKSPRYFRELVALLDQHGVRLVPEREFRFNLARRWRFDLAWPRQKLAVEIDGGLFVNGRHNRGAALRAQYEKTNAAALAGWRVLHYLPEQLTKAASDVARALGA